VKMASPRIATVTGSLSRAAGGMFISVSELCLHTELQGASVSVFGSRDKFFEQDRERWADLNVNAFTIVGPTRFGFCPGLRRRKIIGDILHQHGVFKYTSLVTSRWRTKTRRPVVISPHGMLDLRALAASRIKKAIALSLYERQNIANASCIRALNIGEVDAIRVLGFTNPVAIIPNGVTVPNLQDVSRPEWFPTGKRILLFLGRIHPKKGLLDTIDAWSELAARSPAIVSSWVLAIAGWDDGGHLAALKAQVAKRSLSRHILFPGPLFGAAKTAALVHAGAFILASRSEGLPMSVLEAWAHGVPTFITDACNLPEGYSANAAFRIASDPHLLANRLMDVLPNDTLLKHASRAGIELVTRTFTWPSVAQRMMEVYMWLMNKSPPPECVEFF
jgi:glycosyltransferase involved in cell wall biosynthesis